MKKRLIPLLLVLALFIASAVALVSCDNGDNGETGASETKETATGGTDNTEGTTESSIPSDTEGSEDTEGKTDEESSESETSGTPACEHPYAATPAGHWKPACDVCGKKEGKVQAHEYEERVEDEGDLLVYALRCVVCKYRAYEQEVPYEINSFYSAGELAYTDTTGSLVGNFAFDAGIGYASYSSDNGGSVNVIVLSNGEVEDPSGNYLVMKVRTAKSQSSFTASIKSVGAQGSVNMLFSGLKSGWNTIIVDITKAVKDGTDKSGNVTKLGYQPDASGEYYLGDFRLVASAAAGESFDVCYVMFCDSLEDAKSFTESDKNVITYDDVLNKGGTTDNKQCVDENGNPIIHEYIVNDDGTHTLKETCYQCGLAAVEGEPHTYAQMVIDGDYTYACGACGHLQFGANVNKYISASQIAATAPTYYRVNKLGVLTDSDGKFEYASFSGQGGTAQILFARDNSVAADSERAGAFAVGNANYFILKMRTTNPEVSFGIQIGTDGDGTTNFRFPTAVSKANEWAVYVVDFSAIIDTYKPDADGSYKITQFYYHIGGADFTGDVVYDIAYNAFVSSWDEVDAIVEDSTVINVTAANTGSIIKTDDKSCADDHAYAVDSSSGAYTVKCSSCGYVLKTYNISGAIAFYPAEVLRSKTDTNGKVDITYTTEENGQTFVHLDNMQTNGISGGNWMGWNVINSSTGVKAGRFMIIKVRIGENGLGQSFLKLYTGTKQGVVSEGQGVSLKVSEDGQWHTIVVDLYTRIGEPDKYMIPEGDGSFMIKALQIRPFSNAQPRAEADDWMDIEYIAFCDELSDLASIIAEEQYEWSVSDSQSEIRDFSGAGEGGGDIIIPDVPTDETLSHNVSESSREEADGSVTYTYTCTHCDMNIVKNIPMNVVGYFMSPGDIASTAKVYYKLPTHKVMSDGSDAFTRYTGEGTTAQALWYRSQADCKYDTLTGTHFMGLTLDVGNSEYLVLRARTNDKAQHMNITISTTAKNGSTAIADASTVQSGKSYYDINGNKLEVGATYCTSTGYKAISVPLSANANDEWAVYVINLPEVLGEYYAKDSETGTYVIDTLYLHFEGFAESTNIDMSYMAFVEKWEDIGTIVDEATVTKVTDLDGNYGMVDIATGGCAEHIGVVEVVDGRYVSRCSACGLMFVDYGVKADSVSSFMPAETLTSSGNVYGSANREYMTENGISFVRISNVQTNGIENGNWFGINYSPTGGQGYQAKYMVIKFRIGENGLGQNLLDFYISTKASGALAAGSRVGVKVSEDGQWHTMVIDLTARVTNPSYYAADGDGNYYLRFLQIRPFTYQQTIAEADDYMDISYIALFNELDELKNIISDETYEWSVDSSTNSLKGTENNACITHNIKETVDGETHNLVCVNCGITLRSFTVPEEINWYSDYSQMSVFQHSLEKYMYDEEVDVIYNRYSGAGGNHLNITGGEGAGAADTDAFVAGRYFVMKYRATSNGGMMELKISSDGVVGNQLTTKVGERGYTYLHDDWTVVVIDLSELEHYKVGETGHFYAMITTQGQYQFDIAYVAVVDTLEEAELLLDEGESYVDLGKTWTQAE